MGVWHDEEGDTVRLPQSRISWMRENLRRYVRPVDRLLAEATIYSVKADYPRMGVYLLIAAGRVVYVGQSKQVYYRLNQHVVAGKVFDSVVVIPTPDIAMGDVESYYVRLLRPPLNVAQITRMLTDEEQDASLA